MRLSILPSLAFIFASSLIQVKGCDHANASADALTIGSNKPSDPATIGYNLNHFGLVVNDVNTSLHFYTEVLGMRHLFTFRATSNFDVVYLAYSQGGMNGTGYQTTEEMLAEKTNRAGLLELVCYTASNSTLKASTTAPNTFSHVGMVVPDVEKTQARMEQYGIEILKRVGEDISGKGEIANAFGFGAASASEVKAGLVAIDGIGFKDFLIVTDPDGNLIEIQNQS